MLKYKQIRTMVLDTVSRLVKADNSKRRDPQDDDSTVSSCTNTNTALTRQDESTERETLLRDRLKKKQRELDEVKKESSLAEQENTKLAAALGCSKAGNDKLHAVVAAQWKKQATISTALEESRTKVSELEDRSQRQQKSLKSFRAVREELAEAKRALDVCERQRVDVEALLQLRTTELQDAQAFLGKADIVAYADVQRMVESLNSEIFQTSAQITDVFPFNQARAHEDYNLLRPTLSSISSSVGTPLAYAVANQAHSDDPILVQIMTQSYLAERAGWAVKAWDIRFDKNCDRTLRDIHSSIFEGESQAVSARWRAMTHRYIKSVLGEWPGGLAPAFGDHLMKGLADILILSGVATTQANRKEKLRAAFGEKVLNIANLTLQIRQAIAEGVLSSDFEVLSPRCDEPFCETLMENMEEGDRRKGAKLKQGKHTGLPILCTTELGLLRREKKSTTGTAGGDMTIDTNVPIKAKVALHSLVREWSAPEQRRPM